MGVRPLDHAAGAWVAVPRLLAAILATASGGCSLLIDPDRLRQSGGERDARDDEIDAGPDFDAHLDAPPGALQAFGLAPAFVHEGSGAGAGSPPFAVVIGGLNLDDTTTVTADDPRVEIVGPTLASSDGTLLGTAVRVAVDATLADGVDANILLTVTKGDETGDVELVVRGLDELTLAAGDTTVAAGTFKPRYSRITVSDAASLRGTSALPARLVATASIAVSARLDADGRNGGLTAAGGCAGGGGAAAGSCAGGGQAGGSGGGGGGGGHVVAGSGGDGAGGDGGMAVNDLMLVPLESSAGSGGGGGGAGGLNAPGGAGGAGGGVIFLDSAGDLTLDAEVSARGGGGADGTCVTGLNAGGGGGGGAGGALLFRAAGALGGAAPFAVAGGLGAEECEAGGAGAAGRVRVDHPGTDLPGGLASSGAPRGPMWAADAVVVTDDPAYSITLFGGINQAYEIHVNGGATVEMQTAVNQRAEVSPALVPGLNQICALAVPDLNQIPSEAETCRAVAYLP